MKAKSFFLRHFDTNSVIFQILQACGWSGYFMSTSSLALMVLFATLLFPKQSLKTMKTMDDRKSSAAVAALF